MTKSIDRGAEFPRAMLPITGNRRQALEALLPFLASFISSERGRVQSGQYRQGYDSEPAALLCPL